MELVSAVAGVATLVEVALKSTKIIYQTFSAMKDGPRVVVDLANQVEQLQLILQRVSALPIDLINTNDSMGLADATKKCAAAVAALETRMQKFSASSTNRHSGQLWKRFKAVFGEKELQLIRQTMQGHVSLLTLHLNVVQMRDMSASGSQLSQIYELLKELKGDVAGLKVPSNSIATTNQTTKSTSAASYTEQAEEDRMVPEASEPESCLGESLSRLIEVVSQTKGTVESEDALQLIDDLQSLLETARKHHNEPHQAATTVATIEPLHDGREKVQDVRRELQLISSLICSSPLMDINRLASKPLQPVAQGSLFQQIRKQKSINLAGGVLTISIKCQRRRRRFQKNNEDSPSKYERDFFGSITLHSVMTLRLQQGERALGIITSIPNLHIKNTVPNVSKAFYLALEGNTEGLVSLFEEGKAGLHDRDENGWSLLHYACLGNRTKLCRFLTEHGLEVDEISTNEEYYNQFVFPRLHEVANDRWLTFFLAHPFTSLFGVTKWTNMPWKL
ncbi:hypothetical protein B0T21DRAFT_406061 [Apiosordaria backusii]|uniref:Azaphilone pigments biosynthesis cluster protein L N-terminal domain-containing protein n=1 Tax=Apiosordaria backusii TaxID=314023 RepID=A0AA40EXL9_9PEZI|nr:hypothetical protein B0T21DRAFT_406061 [Apiosordaria backusii]